MCQGFTMRMNPIPWVECTIKLIIHCYVGCWFNHFFLISSLIGFWSFANGAVNFNYEFQYVFFFWKEKRMKFSVAIKRFVNGYCRFIAKLDDNSDLTFSDIGFIDPSLLHALMLKNLSWAVRCIRISIAQVSRYEIFAFQIQIYGFDSCDFLSTKWKSV